MSISPRNLHNSLKSTKEKLLPFFLTSKLVHPYHLDESVPSFSVFRVGVFIFTVFCTEISPISKKCRP